MSDETKQPTTSTTSARRRVRVGEMRAGMRIAATVPVVKPNTKPASEVRNAQD